MRPKDSLKTAQYGGDVAQSCLAVRNYDAILHDATKNDAIKNDLVGGVKHEAIVHDFKRDAARVFVRSFAL